MKNLEKMVLNIITGIFGVIGIGLLAVGIILFINSARYKNTFEKIDAEITNIEVSRKSDGELRHSVYIKYTYKDKLYDNVRINFYSSSMYEGKVISVLCDPDNPGKIRSIEGTNLAAIILVFIGTIFVIVTIIPMVSIIKKDRRKKRAIASGRILDAVIEKIDINNSYTINGRNPYIIYCIYKDEYYDKIYRFKSDNLWTDPGLILHPGDIIQVHVDEKDYSCYHVDTKRLLDGKIIDYT